MTGKIVDKRIKVTPNIIRGLVILILLYIIIMVIVHGLVVTRVIKG